MSLLRGGHHPRWGDLREVRRRRKVPGVLDTARGTEPPFSCLDLPGLAREMLARGGEEELVLILGIKLVLRRLPGSRDEDGCGSGPLRDNQCGLSSHYGVCVLAGNAVNPACW
jgi:hypothetical protein